MLSDLAPPSPGIKNELWTCECIKLAEDDLSLYQIRTFGSHLRVLLSFLEDHHIILDVTFKQLDSESDIAIVREYAREVTESIFRGIFSAFSRDGGCIKEVELKKIESSMMMLQQAIWNYPGLCRSGKSLIHHFFEKIIRPIDENVWF